MSPIRQIKAFSTASRITDGSEEVFTLCCVQFIVCERHWECRLTFTFATPPCAGAASFEWNLDLIVSGSFMFSDVLWFPPLVYLNNLLMRKT